VIATGCTQLGIATVYDISTERLSKPSRRLDLDLRTVQSPVSQSPSLLGRAAVDWCDVALLYPLCRWVAAVKARRTDWWLSYL
jgi:hypothetical protein